VLNVVIAEILIVPTKVDAWLPISKMSLEDSTNLARSFVLKWKRPAFAYST